MKKEHLPGKKCPTCLKNFNWRKKWKLNWEQVKYCSKKCTKFKNKILQSMNKILSSCEECGEDKSILTQVSCTVEIKYLCADCYKNKFTTEERKEIETTPVITKKIKN